MSDCCSTTGAIASADAFTVKAEPARFVCPRCGQPGRVVSTQTLKHQVKPEHLETVETGVFHFCRTPACEVVYFNGNGVVLSKADMRQRIGLKETQDPVPVCYCFGFTEKMIFDELRATGQCTIPKRIAAEIKAGHCACEVRNPQGGCCLGNVQAVVKRALAADAAEKASPALPSERKAASADAMQIGP
jgi:Zinc binding domain